MRRALVLGGGIAGLTAAVVLADHAEEVIVVERDDLATDSDPRRPNPSAPHSLGIHELARRQFDRWLPGLTETLLGEGARPVDSGSHWHVDGVRKAPVAGEPLICLTAPLLQRRLRDRVAALPAVHLIRGKATGLTHHGSRVDGALVADPGRRGPGDRIGADLVVDAMGRSSRLGEWLARAGYPTPPTRRVVLDLGYATRLYRRDPDGRRVDDPDSVYSLRTGRLGPAGGLLLLPVEGDRWSATVLGYGDARPTRDVADFEARCRAEPVAALHRLVRTSAPVSEVAAARHRDSRRRDFHRMRRLPAGLAALGDSVASLNPVYGQGLSVALLQAGALHAWLRTPGAIDEPAAGYFDRSRVVVDAAWRLSAAGDLLLPNAEARRAWGMPLSRGLAGLLARATITDAGVHRRYLDVAAMRRHPRELARPRFVLSTMRAALRSTT
ncbi:2-polyprenyl-6-methoxyphenol hydroxylase-like FAD-dependent oxidoreductase [Actinoalloteichus hoggarensis]|uniref:Putative epoxidase LasC n=1 Tax=Actinoalloteichus hoggarensis TaxID=1470176 RepID=A0A221W2B5_9PSEU|nr:FAD-binding protein [Actinoalloteichus hoggarensis]ASO19741.1 Putative epoxidase LasC [Actinoalloteichus hoggarensis]MBB5919552.1 2-polyprenyl-6-methoxyphenol hydroxylase-like FAD-dependent oxidoreductase [Actinoalloteichus hoggarensis]